MVRPAPARADAISRSVAPLATIASSTGRSCSLDQLRGKGLVDKDVLTDDYAEYSVYWPIVEGQAEGVEGSEVFKSGTIEEDDYVPF